MKHLTSRQWEVLSRLLRGERVPTIAAGLFISQSTVRNHLAGIFERFGVHSQPELLAVLAAKRTGDLSD
jgi:two-component system nitrate/nitrite response regulator NarL